MITAKSNESELSVGNKVRYVRKRDMEKKRKKNLQKTNCLLHVFRGGYVYHMYMWYTTEIIDFQVAQNYENEIPTKYNLENENKKILYIIGNT